MMKYMKSIMDVSRFLPPAPEKEPSLRCFAHRGECSGGWAGCDFNQAYFYLCVLLICMAEAMGEREGRNELGENE